MPATTTTLKRNLSIYFVMGFIGVFSVLVGFSKTFFIPMGQGAFSAPVTVHIHGAFAFAWILFYLLQTSLVHWRNVRMHRSIGWLGAFIAVGVAVTMLPAGLFQVERDTRLGLGDAAVSSILGIVTSAIMFTGLVGAGLYFRKKPEVHKPLMLLATIFVLWPAWFRFRHFFPSVARPDIWFGLVLSESFIVLAWIVDWHCRGKVNRILLYVGAFIMVETTVEVLMFDSPPWRTISATIYSMLQGGM